VRRILPRSGRGRVYLNGALATAAQLYEIVGPLIDVTSQHEHQSLGEPKNHREALDAFAGLARERAAMAAAWQELRAAEAELQGASGDESARAEREDFLRFQIGQIDELAPRAGEDSELLRERDRLRASARLEAAATQAEELLYGGEGATFERVASALGELVPVSRIDAALAPVVTQLEEARALLEDASFRLRRYRDDVPRDPERLAAIEERLEALGKLLRKHGPTADDVRGRRETMARELNALGASASRREQAAARVAGARAQAEARAGDLSRLRAQAADGLCARVHAALAEMQMQGARLAVALAPAVDGVQAHGRDRVELHLAPNPGEPTLPLSRVASGGELSRVMLACKLVTASADAVATYVFDEVDAGIGGGVAERVGRLLREVSRHRQVLCVTHLPQIAAFADAHLMVQKREHAGRTVQKVRRLDGPARERELARMMAGLEVTAQARAHAADMLRRARA
jgi:DNA repair protein RecN (Recombination protein N)